MSIAFWGLSWGHAAQHMGSGTQTYLPFLPCHLFLIYFKDLICSCDELNNTWARVFWQVGSRKGGQIWSRGETLSTSVKGDKKEKRTPLLLVYMMTYTCQGEEHETVVMELFTQKLTLETTGAMLAVQILLPALLKDTFSIKGQILAPYSHRYFVPLKSLRMTDVFTQCSYLNVSSNPRVDPVRCQQVGQRCGAGEGGGHSVAHFWKRKHLEAKRLVQLLELFIRLLLALAQDTAHHVATLLWWPLKGERGGYEWINLQMKSQKKY